MSRNDRGAALIQVAFGLLALMGFSTFVLDYGVYWTSRRQSQNAADSAAMSGAIALAYDDPSDTTGVVSSAALTESQQNVIWGQTPSVIAASDIQTPATGYTCPTDGTSSCVRVDVYRTVARSNPLPIFFGELVGLSTQDVKGSAVAQVYEGNASNCLMPWGVLDEDSNNNPYTVAADYGTEVQLKVGPGLQPGPGWFQGLALGAPGASTYRANIEGCANVTYGIGDTLPIQTGNMSGPTKQGVDALIAEDPNAYWCGPATGCTPPASCQNAAAGCIEGSAYETNGNALQSPRIVSVPLLNVADYNANGSLVLQNILGFFVVSDQGNGNQSIVTGVLVTTPALIVSGKGTVGPSQSFAKVIQLVR